LSAGGNKAGDITTSNDAKLKSLVIFNRDLNIARLTAIEGTFVASGTISKTTLDGSIRNSVFLVGGGDNNICLKHHNIDVKDITEWATTEGNDKVNVLEIGGNSGILLHQGAANAGTDIKIINSKAGNIVLKVGTGGGIKNNTKDSFTVLHDDNFPGAAIGRLSPQAFDTNATNRTNDAIARLEIECITNRKGIRLFKYDDISTVSSLKTKLSNESIETPAITATTATTTSLVISGNYTGSTTNRLYKNADNKLFWNNIELTSAPIPTLAQLLNSGATASQPINMNSKAITGITTLEGSSGGNWLVKQLTEATGIDITETAGNYTIANIGVISVAKKANTNGLNVDTTSGAVIIENTGILGITQGAGIYIPFWCSAWSWK
jgi:hypothetical protein